MLSNFFRKIGKSKKSNAAAAAATALSDKHRYVNGSADQDFLTGVRQSRLPLLEDQQLREIRSPRAASGFPVVDVEQIVASQKALLGKIKDQGAFTNQEWEELVLPVIWNLAAYVHLLPASQEHHHDDAGGLFRHSLEVGYYALRYQYDFHIQRTVNPQHQRKIEFRWKFCYFLGALLHDIGKPLSDFWVLHDPDKPKSNNWNPHVESLHAWAVRNNVKTYYLNWSPMRNNKHLRLATLVLTRIVPDNVLIWLNKYSTTPYITMVDFLSMPSTDNQVGKVVYSADSESVAKNLKSKRNAADQGSPAFQPLAVVFHAMRALIARGDWLVNKPGARVWVVDDDHAYVLWKAAAKDIYGEARRFGNTIIPSDPDVLARMLIDHGYATEYEDDDNRKYYYHRIAIPMATATLLKPHKKPPSGYALMLDVSALFDSISVPKPIEVTVYPYDVDIEETKSAKAESSDAGVNSDSKSTEINNDQEAPDEDIVPVTIPAEPAASNNGQEDVDQKGTDTESPASNEAANGTADTDSNAVVETTQAQVSTPAKPTDHGPSAKPAAQASSAPVEQESALAKEVLEHAGNAYLFVPAVETLLGAKGLKLAEKLEEAGLIESNPEGAGSPVVRRNNKVYFQLKLAGTDQASVLGAIEAMSGANAKQTTKSPAKQKTAPAQKAASPDKAVSPATKSTEPAPSQTAKATPATNVKTAAVETPVSKPTPNATTKPEDKPAAKPAEPKKRKPKSTKIHPPKPVEASAENKAPVASSGGGDTSTADAEIVEAFLAYLLSTCDEEGGIKKDDKGAINFTFDRYRIFLAAHPAIKVPIYRFHNLVKTHPNVTAVSSDIKYSPAPEK